MKRTYTASLGSAVFTRTTERTYTHVVVQIIDPSAERARRMDGVRRYFEMNKEHMARVAAGDAPTWSGHPEKEREHARAFLKAGAEGHALIASTKYDIDLEMAQRDRGGHLVVVGYCRTLALAESRAATARRQGKQVEILLLAEKK